jgi:serine/threonine protein phosphatase PrpC
MNRRCALRPHARALCSQARRIIAAGGWVEFNRVNGNLALSRALGDFVFKRNEDMPAEEQIVTANPDIITRDLTPDVEFMVLACDGIWDVMSNQVRCEQLNVTMVCAGSDRLLPRPAGGGHGTGDGVRRAANTLSRARLADGRTWM